ncbi:hypothetical protein ACIPWF_23670, partial [Paenarthrobacter sp. NPDC089989]|uniref:hypothetical protein n=1 Tax=unclassified Paenarthrobacter TaxID=2634190 RepID=UPI0037FA10E1
TLVTFFVACFLVQDMGVLACRLRHDFDALSLDDLESVVTGVGRCRETADRGRTVRERRA